MGAPQDGALYAVRHDTEWHLAEYVEDFGSGGVFVVIGTGMQCGDRWLPEWIDRTVFVDGPENENSARSLPGEGSERADRGGSDE